MKLAIKGHLERGKEVIKILEMMGGINKLDLNGTQIDSYYYIDNIDSKIHLGLSIYPYDYTIYTLEEFLEKFPYKVGDKVWLHYENLTIRTTETIISMRWCSKYDCVLYDVCTCCNLKEYAFTPYKEETMEEKEPEPKAPILSNRYDYAEGKCGYVIPDGYEFDSIKQGFQTEIILRPIKSQYPKTYEECCKIVDYYLEGTTIIGYNKYLLERFQQLLICRDTYWKIAGEQMRLSKPWKPDYTDDNIKYVISIHRNHLDFNVTIERNYILIFPTEEIRDIFYENFKELIENCKELL